MNTKFIRDEYGLRLELVPANDNERVLIAEILSKNPYGFKQKNLTVAGANDKLTVYRPVYINKQVLLVRGFKFGELGSTGLVYAWKYRYPYVLILIGSGSFFLSKVEIDLKQETQIDDIYVLDYNKEEILFEYVFNGFSGEFYVTRDHEFKSGLQTIEQLDNVLKELDNILKELPQ